MSNISCQKFSEPAPKNGLLTKAYAARAAGENLQQVEIKRRKLRPQDVLIAIHYCGVCHSDIHQVRDEWGGGIFPMVPGHEITGVVVARGPQVNSLVPGDTVGVGCMVDSCQECNPCLDGDEQYCERGPTFTYNSRERDGVTPTFGGYSGYIVVDENFVLRIPRHLPLDSVAPLLCAGITTFSPLHNWRVSRGQHVAVVGLGGLGHLAVKFAKAMGAQVTVLSHSPGKAADAIRLGADHFVSTDESELDQYIRQFHLIVDTISKSHDANRYLDCLQLEGTMVLLGVPPEGLHIDASRLISQRRNLSGSLIGSIAETQKMLDFCGQHNLVADIEVIGTDAINEAIDRVLKGDVRYRFVIDCKSLRDQPTTIIPV